MAVVGLELDKNSSYGIVVYMVSGAEVFGRNNIGPRNIEFSHISLKESAFEIADISLLNVIFAPFPYTPFSIFLAW